MKVQFCKNLLFLLLISTAFSATAVAQCGSLENDSSRLFIAYEKTAKVEVDGAPATDGVVLRLHNHTGCDLAITTGDVSKFYKPLPPNPTVLQRINREFEFDLPDGVLVPELVYGYRTSRGLHRNIGGDMFYILSLKNGGTISFGAPFEHFDLEPYSGIRVELRPIVGKADGRISYGESIYAEFSGITLPSDIQQKIKSRNIGQK